MRACVNFTMYKNFGKPPTPSKKKKKEEIKKKPEQKQPPPPNMQNWKALQMA